MLGWSSKQGEVSDRVFCWKSWVLIFLPKNRNLHGLCSKFNVSGSFGLFGWSFTFFGCQKDKGYRGFTDYSRRKNPLVLRIPYWKVWVIRIWWASWHPGWWLAGQHIRAMKKRAPWLFRVFRQGMNNGHPLMWGLFRKPWNKDPFLNNQYNFGKSLVVHP